MFRRRRNGQQDYLFQASLHIESLVELNSFITNAFQFAMFYSTYAEDQESVNDYFASYTTLLVSQFLLNILWSIISGERKQFVLKWFDSLPMILALMLLSNPYSYQTRDVLAAMSILDFFTKLIDIGSIKWASSSTENLLPEAKIQEEKTRADLISGKKYDAFICILNCVTYFSTASNIFLLNKEPLSDVSRALAFTSAYYAASNGLSRLFVSSLDQYFILSGHALRRKRLLFENLFRKPHNENVISRHNLRDYLVELLHLATSISTMVLLYSIYISNADKIQESLKIYAYLTLVRNAIKIGLTHPLIMLPYYFQAGIALPGSYFHSVMVCDVAIALGSMNKMQDIAYIQNDEEEQVQPPSRQEIIREQYTYLRNLDIHDNALVIVALSLSNYESLSDLSHAFAINAGIHMGVQGVTRFSSFVKNRYHYFASREERALRAVGEPLNPANIPNIAARAEEEENQRANNDVRQPDAAEGQPQLPIPPENPAAADEVLAPAVDIARMEVEDPEIRYVSLHG